MYIGFFDSGMGGLTVLKTALHQMPNEKYIYFADSKNTPYGTKSKEVVHQLVLNAVEQIAPYNLKAMVVACNTATSTSLKILREIYDFPIIGMEPAIKPALEIDPDKKVLLFATDLTLKEKKLENLIARLNGQQRVDKISLQELVQYAEDFRMEDLEVLKYLNTKLKNINWEEYSSVVLGCTHFIFYKNYFKKLLPDQIEIIDGNLGTILNLKNQIIPTKRKVPSPVRFLNSGESISSNAFKRYLNILF